MLLDDRAGAFNVFPSRAVVGLARKDDVQKLWFRTTTGDEFSGRMAPWDSRIENMFDVHCIGQRDGKYMKFRQKKAPLLDRRCCEYTRDFAAPPLGDHVIARQHAETNKEHNLASGDGAPQKAPFMAVTKYVDDFRAPTCQEARKARPRSAAPKQTMKVNPKDRLENLSHEHSQFMAPSGATASWSSTRVYPPQANLAVMGPAAAACWPARSVYQEQFGAGKKPTRCKSAPGRRLSDLAPRAPTVPARPASGKSLAVRGSSHAARGHRPASAAQARGTKAADAESPSDCIDPLGFPTRCAPHHAQGTEGEYRAQRSNKHSGQFEAVERK